MEPYSTLHKSQCWAESFCCCCCSACTIVWKIRTPYFFIKISTSWTKLWQILEVKSIPGTNQKEKKTMHAHHNQSVHIYRLQNIHMHCIREECVEGSSTEAVDIFASFIVNFARKSGSWKYFCLIDHLFYLFKVPHHLFISFYYITSFFLQG